MFLPPRRPLRIFPLSDNCEGGKAKNEPDFRFPQHYRNSAWLFSLSFLGRNSKRRWSVNGNHVWFYVPPLFLPGKSRLCQHLDLKRYHGDLLMEMTKDVERVQSDDRKNHWERGVVKASNLLSMGRMGRARQESETFCALTKKVYASGIYAWQNSFLTQRKAYIFFSPISHMLLGKW